MTAQLRGRDWRAGARRAGVLLLVGLAVASCGGGGGGGDDEAAAATTSTTAPSDSIQILVTSADGLQAPGLTPLADGLYTEHLTQAVVAAPVPADPTLPAAPAPEGAPVANFSQTASGFPAMGVQSDPATTVTAALTGQVDQMVEGVDLVVLGVNDGQIVGPLAGFDNDIAAAQAAVDQGVPALIVAAGLDEVPPDYNAAVAQVQAWLQEHREALMAGDEPAAITILSVPGCGFGTVRGVVEVPIATDAAGRDPNAVDCGSTAENPVDDIAAFTTGFATLTTYDTGGGGTDGGATATTAAESVPATTVTTAG